VSLPSRVPDAAVIVYLHGFASSPHSSKAAYFAERLRGHGLDLISPDLCAPEFERMTMSRMLAHVQELIVPAREPVTLLGSSLGGALAILAAARLPQITQLVLMAPAVMFAHPIHHLVSPAEAEEWRRAGTRPFFYYGKNEMRSLDYEFYQDSLQYDTFATEFPQPALVFQGVRDEVVAHETVAAFAARRRHAALVALDDDHSLHASLPRIWKETEAFLGLVD
jgi:pimeloyl-ACP methyl ester carboxylesterase